MFFSRRDEGSKVLEAACKAGGLTLDRGRIIGSPERINLFTLSGDLLRLDLDLDAHLGSTLQPSSTLLIEKGNRVDDGRLEMVRELARRDADACVLM